MTSLSALLPSFNVPSVEAREWMDDRKHADEARERVERRYRNLKAACIPDKFRDARIENCHKKAQDWVRTTLRGRGDSLLLYGPQGRGKTYTACAALIAVLPELRGLYTDAKDMLETIKASFDLPGETTASASSRYTVPRVLVIDDLGSMKPTEWRMETLFHVIKRRHEMNRPTIITTMYEPDQLAKRLVTPDEAMRAKAIFSRLQEAERIRFDGPDRRCG